MPRITVCSLAWILFWLGAPIYSQGQICSGNLGRNIFEEGDFGSGAANIPLTDPQIAPGYFYDPTPPPYDGSYCLTNNIARWSSSFSWMQIQDNSPDPNGYMMVVNASYDPGLFYEQTVEGLCENTAYVFTADVYNLIRSGSNNLKPNVSFLIDGVEFYSTGLIPENQRWNTYGFGFSTLPGQTTVTLSLRNNAAGGIGNDLALDNITFRPCGPEALILPTEIANICEDGSSINLFATIVGNQYETPVLQWQRSADQGATWTDIPGANDTIYPHSILSGGDYYYRYLLANDPANLLNDKCRVVSNEKIVRVIPKFYTVIDTICEGLTYPFNNGLLRASGTYIDSLKTSIGCDSIVTLLLTVTPDPGIDAIFSLQDPSCSYLTDGTVLLEAIARATQPTKILFNSRIISQGTPQSNLQAGPYSISIEDRYGCRLDTLLRLNLPEPFVIDIGPDWEGLAGDTLLLKTISNFPVGRFNWQPSGQINCETDCDSLAWIPPSSMQLSLRAISQNGCIATDSLFVRVTQLRNIFIPSGFTPNGDGSNDFFTVYGNVPSAQEVDRFVIYDRWGKVMFERSSMSLNEPSTGWDGRMMGRLAPEGVYQYVAYVRFLDGRIVPFSGSVTLLR